MNSLDFLHYIVAFSIILVSVVVIGIGISIMLFLFEARKALQLAQKAAQEIRLLKNIFQTGKIGSVVSFGKNLFQKKLK